MNHTEFNVALRRRLEHVRAEAKALEDILALYEKEERPRPSTSKDFHNPFEMGSLTAQAYEIVVRDGGPIHGNVVCDKMGVIDSLKDSLKATLGRLVHVGVLKKTAPATYAPRKTLEQWCLEVFPAGKRTDLTPHDIHMLLRQDPRIGQGAPGPLIVLRVLTHSTRFDRTGEKSFRLIMP